MTEISERFDRLSKAFRDKVAQVPPERWDAPSPCEGWTARDVVHHVATTPAMFYRFIGAEPPALPVDPVEALPVMHADVLAKLEDPAVATTEFEGFFGRSTWEAAVDGFVNFDLVIHNWDLSKAAGLDTTIPDDDLGRVEAAAEGFGDAGRSPGVFGPAIDPPPGADRQTRLLCFVGRDPS